MVDVDLYTCVLNFGLLGISYRFDFKKEISVLSLIVRLQLILIINLVYPDFIVGRSSSVILFHPEKLAATMENSSGVAFMCVSLKVLSSFMVRSSLLTTLIHDIRSLGMR